MNRLAVALIAYGVLGITAYIVLSGLALSVVLIVFGGLIAKTVLWHFFGISSLRTKLDRSGDSTKDEENLKV